MGLFSSSWYIWNIMDNKELSDRLGKQGRQKILNEFNISTQVDKLLNIWQDIHENVVK